MTLTGIEIIVKGRKKFVGKVGVCPPNNSVPKLAGYVVFYREAKSTDVFSYATKTYGVDKQAYDKAVDLGAQGMAIYLTDKRTMICVSKEIIDKSFVLDLGERGQARIKPGQCKVYNNVDPIHFGYTNNVITIPERTGILG